VNEAKPHASVVVAAPSPLCLRALEAQTVESGTFEVVAAADAAVGQICIFLGADVIAAPSLVAAHMAGHAERRVGLGTLTNEFAVGRSPHIGARRLFPGNVSVPRDAIEEELEVVELVARLEASGFELRRLPGADGVRMSNRHTFASEGAAHAELARRSPALRSRLLGWFPDATPRELVLRRAALAVHASPAALGSLGRLLPRAARTRWSLFVSNYAFWSAVRDHLEPSDWDGLTRGVPVLLYHAFGDEENRFVVARAAFARQLRLLSLLRFAVRPYAEVAGLLREGLSPPPRTVALTFDDGYADNADIAVPLLTQHGFAATIYVVSERLNDVNDWSAAPPLRGRRLLAAEQLGPLQEQGIDFGAHTRTHRDLSQIPSEVVRYEVGPSRAELEAELGTPARTFAYPYGRVGPCAVAAVQAAGFDSACTTDPRLAQLDDDPCLIPRIEIKHGDSLWRFAWKLWFGGG
jgi:peptidoglycan/xylan/chitin deacetylase (PgdA/CDA1 family)